MGEWVGEGSGGRRVVVDRSFRVNFKQSDRAIDNLVEGLCRHTVGACCVNLDYW